jgi:hypothetical protein
MLLLFLLYDPKCWCGPRAQQHHNFCLYSHNETVFPTLWYLGAVEKLERVVRAHLLGW